MGRRARVKTRAVWGPNFKDDPMNPFRGVPLPSETVKSPADTLTTALKKVRRTSWGALKAEYRRKDEE